MHESLRHSVTTHNWFAHYLRDIYGGFGHNGKMIHNAPFPPILSHHTSICLPWPVFETSHTLEEKHVRESLRHGVSTHNWFVNYLWDIYGGFGHNGKKIQCTPPSHTRPSRPKIDCLGQFLKLHTLWKRNICVKVYDTVLPPITGLCITFGTYMEALGTTGR